MNKESNRKVCREEKQKHKGNEMVEQGDEGDVKEEEESMNKNVQIGT